MKRFISLFLLLAATLVASAQNAVVKKSASQAFDALMQPFKESYQAQVDKEAQVRTYGDYEIRLGQDLWGKQGYFCLWDKAAGKFLIPPISDELVKKYKKWDWKQREKYMPDGTYRVNRMFFMDSEKGPMAGCPEQLNGCLWLQGGLWYAPDSLMKNGKPVLNKKKVKYIKPMNGIFRIVDGKLEQVLKLGAITGHTSIYGANGPWKTIQEKPEKVLALDLSINRMEPLSGTDYYLIFTDHFQTDYYIYGEECIFNEWQSVDVFDWTGKERLTGARSVVADGGRIWVQKEGAWNVYKPDFTPLKPEYEALRPATVKGFGPAIAACKEGRWGLLNDEFQELIPFIYPSFDGKGVNLKGAVTTQFKKVSYTVWYNAQAARYSAKDEFEKQEQYQARMADPALQAKYVDEKMQGAREAYFKSFRLDLVLDGPYDAENECFRITPACLLGDTDKVLIPWHSFLVKVPIGEAPAFKEAFDAIKEEAAAGARLSLVGDVPFVEQISFTTPAGKTYVK